MSHGRLNLWMKNQRHRIILETEGQLYKLYVNFQINGGFMSLTLASFKGQLYLSQDTILLPGGSDGKESACNAGDPGLILRLGRCLGEGNSYPLQWPILAWRIPWKGEPGGLQFMGLQRIRHNWVTNTFITLSSLHLLYCQPYYAFLIFWTACQLISLES